MKTQKNEYSIINKILFKTLEKTSGVIASQETDILNVLKNILNFTNNEIEKHEISYNLTLKQLLKEVKIFEFLEDTLSFIFKLFFDELNKDEMKIIESEYKKFTNSLENIRAVIQTCTEIEVNKIDEFKKPN